MPTSYSKAHRLSSLNMPAKVLVVKNVPVLGTGKTDIRGVQALVEASEQLD